jgi:hypothetical protein
MKLSFLIITLIIILFSCHSNLKNSNQAKEVLKKDTNISTNNFVEADSIEVKRQRLLDTNNTFLNTLPDSSLNLAYRQGLDKPFTATVTITAVTLSHIEGTFSATCKTSINATDSAMVTGSFNGNY